MSDGQAERLEAIGRLAGGIGHDFNNLLAVIGAYSEMVADAVGDAALDDPERWNPVERDVGRIRGAAERAAELTRQLLAFARREVTQPQVISLNDTVTEVVQLLGRTLGDDVQVLTALDADPWPVLADPSHLEQVLMNLSINARDAMPNGGTLRIGTANITVDDDAVAAGATVPPGRYVRLRVSDTGEGMAPDVADRAFDPFYTTKATGTGLGLATVHGIVAQCGGTVTITSDPGNGTTFTVVLPVTSEPAWDVVEPANYERTPKGECVLVVEDQDALREITARILERAGYRVLTAADGAGAIAAATEHREAIHLLVTDVVMPSMLGMEVAQRVAEIHPEIEVLFMSGYAQPVLAAQGRLEPGVALVDKPFSAQTLLARAAQVLNGHFRGFRTSRRGARAVVDQKENA